MRSPSARQSEILEFLANFAAAHGMAPSIGEVAEHFGIAPATASGHLQALRRKHLIERSGKARSIVLIGRDPAAAVLKIPLYGRFDDPDPEENRPYLEGVVHLHRSAAGNLPGESLFALRVPDGAMRDLGIFRDDTAVFAPPAELTPRLGDVVAAFVGGAAVIRSFFPHGSGGTVSLRASHPQIPETELATSDVRILGVLIALLRRYPR